MSLLSLRTAQLLSGMTTLWLNFFLRWGEVKRFVGGFCFVRRFLERRHSKVVRLYWPEFCTDSFFLWFDGVDFLYRRCYFMHAGLFCVSALVSAGFWRLRLPCCFPALRWLDLLAFLTGRKLSARHTLTKQWHLWYSVTFDLSCLSQRLKKLFTVRRM